MDYIIPVQINYSKQNIKEKEYDLFLIIMELLVELLQVGDTKFRHNKILFVILVLIWTIGWKNTRVLKVIHCFQFIFRLLRFVHLLNGNQLMGINLFSHVYISKASLAYVANEFKILLIHLLICVFIMF